MASQVNPPRGMRDFLPADKARREYVLGIIRRQFRSHGFDEIETPVMEDSSRLNAGLGGDNEKLAFGVLRRGLTESDYEAVAHGANPLTLLDMGLRFDLTVPLARFYATHRAELPTVFRSIQIAPVWRAERPQKGRYRQFVQCDIDIIGEPSHLAEVELLVATASTLEALGLTGCSIRINDRRLLTSMLSVFGFDAAVHESVLVTLDKMDKIELAGIVAELRERMAGDADDDDDDDDDDDVAGDAISALETFLSRPRTMEFVAFGERAIRRELPEGVDEAALQGLVDLGEAVVAAGIDRSLLQFDPFLVRGMGYYTGPIFEIAHPDFGYSLGGGGRYDGMIGRFLGTEVSATGFSLGFERIVDLVAIEDAAAGESVALVFDASTPAAVIASLKSAVLAQGDGATRVRVERAIRNTKLQLEHLAAAGFSRYAPVDAQSTVENLEFRPIAPQ